ncbi:distal tail protein Dit [Metabacillus sp. HB246100]
MSFEMTFNGQTLPIKVKSVGGRGIVEIEAITGSIPGTDGSYYIRKRMPDKPMPVEFSIFPSSLEDAREKVDFLNSILTVGKVVPVIYSDEPDMTYYAYLSGQPDWDEGFYKINGTLPLIRKPYKYGNEMIIDSIDGNINVNNNGLINKNFNVQVVFNDSVNEYKIIKQSTGEFVRVIYNFVATDILEIDFTKRKILINGIVQMPTLDIASSWFFLDRGNNTIVIDDPLTSESDLTYRPRFA